ncbi:MAG: lamin tail domain-containing protein, partial [Bacteroidales bacterium]|nr:lamin tail domain-containing protein [Bacteroidales bacterium]
MPAALFSLLFLTILNFQAIAQVYDDFSDGNFTANPEWTGDTADFKISNSSAIPAEMKPGLQLNAEESGISSLVVENSMINNTEWRFWVKLSFNTSANNFARIYLTSDQEDLSGTLSGYYVQIGGSNDSIGLYRQEGDTGFLVCQGENIFTGNTTNAIRLKITRDESGNWQMFADPDGGFNFQPEGSGMDGTITSTGYFGLYCRYTSSNATKFYFDDFYVSELNADTIPPEVVSVSVESANTLSVHFSEPVEQIGAENPGNYVVQPGSVTPSSAMRDGTALSKVHLEFEDDFAPGVNYSVLISAIGDLSGNFLEQDSATFYISELTGVDPFSIVINEIMADVDPEPIGLPVADYLELYNSNPYPVNLEGFTLKPRESADPIAFPSAVILPDSFLIVTLPADTQFFASFGPVVGLPGFSLNNEGVSALRNPDGSLVHAIGYQKSWYKDDEKEDGGWALEQIDPLNPCTGGDNWSASNHESGGTPGERNSVDAQNIFAPTIESVVAISQNMTEISFSQIMDSVPMMMPGIFEVDGGIGFPASVNLESPFFTKAYLSFDQPFVENQVYTMTLADTVYGCSGSFIAPGKQFEFVLPVEAEPFEIVFNEVMPDPDPPVELPQYEYIEVFNTTVDYKGIRGWMLQVGETVKPIPDAVIDPHGYLIFTDSEVEQLFGLFGPAVGFSSLGLSNSGTTLKLLNSEGLLMSVLAYEPSWYMDGEKAEGGYSLEQIDPFNPCAGEENWSETLSEKGGTPGTLNSVDAENEVLPSIDHIIALDPQTFEVYFSQVMNRSTLTNPASYTVDHTVGNPVSVTITDSTYRKVRLMFGVQLLKGEVYLMTFPNTILNCNGNPVSQNLTVPFGIHENPKRADVVINEVLFNPAGEGVDFVEIYNRSEKI